jgi:hypothetical protein
LVALVQVWVVRHVLATIHSEDQDQVQVWVDRGLALLARVRLVLQGSAVHAQVAIAVHVLVVQVDLVIAQVAIAVLVRPVQVPELALAVHVRVARQADSTPVAALLQVVHLAKAQLVVAVMRPVLLVAAASRARRASPSALVVKSSTICQHQYSVVQQFHSATVPLFACHVVLRSLTSQNALAQTQLHW